MTKTNNKSIECDAITCFTCQNSYYDRPINDELMQKHKKKILGLVGKSYSLKNIKERFKEIALVSFGRQKNTDEDDAKTPVLAIEKKSRIENGTEIEQYFVKTGLYAGHVVFNGVHFEIKPDCNSALFERMLNFANQIYVDRNDVATKRSERNDFLLIEYIFLSSLQRVAILGLPHEYSKQRYHDIKVHGNIDVANYISKDIPFTGKISSQKNERQYVQSIVDVLYTALKACHSEIQNRFQRLSLIKSELGASFSGQRPTQQTIQNAKKHRVLSNPMYTDFKRTLEFAEIIIQKGNFLPDSTKADSAKASGYLLDVASLWEVYLESLLKQIKGWSVSAQEAHIIYDGYFFHRRFIPDFVLKKDGDDNVIVVLDAKFKKMQFRKIDVDREDVFQIHSYVGYFREKGKEVVLCGLIYPLSRELSEKDLSKNRAGLYGIQKADEAKTTFIIDGVYKGEKTRDSSNDDESETDAPEEKDKEYNVAEAEGNFIERIQDRLDKLVKNLESN